MRPVWILAGIRKVLVAVNTIFRHTDLPPISASDLVRGLQNGAAEAALESAVLLSYGNSRAMALNIGHS